MMIEEFTISVFSENFIGILNRIVAVFTRRHINIESFNTSPSSMEGIYRYTIVINVTEEQVRKLVAQIDKQVEVLKSFYHRKDGIVYQEIALYKIPTKSFMESDDLEILIRKYNARVLSIEEEYSVIEKTGDQEATTSFLNALKPYTVFEFARSGRVAISKPMEQLNNYLKGIKTNEEYSF